MKLLIEREPMVNTLYIFEDPAHVKLFPLAYTRPVYDLRCGMHTLREKVERAYPGATTVLLCRPYLSDVVRQQDPGVRVNEYVPGNSLFVNGRVVMDEQFKKAVPMKGDDAVYLCQGTVVALRLHANEDHSGKFIQGFDLESLDQCRKVELSARLVSYPWDLIHLNADELRNDMARIDARSWKPPRATKFPGVHFVNKKWISIGTGVSIKPGVVLDAEHGPIVIGNSVKILSNAVIEGPAFIGENSTIKAGAKIYGNTSIGPVCKVGGEVEGSILHAYANKQHDGFLGHSYIGMWCNLGADTNTSDLKNNYSSVQAYAEGKMINTGLQFLGLTMGDHSKSGINTMFNTGTVVGISSNIFGAGFPPKHVPSFSWGGAEGMRTYEVEKAIEVARIVMRRRNVTMTDHDVNLVRHVFAMTAKERKGEADT